MDFTKNKETSVICFYYSCLGWFHEL